MTDSTDYIKKYFIRFPSERELISEDLVFNIDYMQHVNSSCTISYIGYMYRFNPSSLTTSYRNDRFTACRHFYEEIKNKLLKLGYDEKVILRLQRLFFVYTRMCIHQEIRKISGLSLRESLLNINNICNDEILQEIIQSYPINKLGIKQRVFLLLLKQKCLLFLYLLSKFNLI